MALIILGAIGFVALGSWMAGLFGEPLPSRRWSPAAVHLIGWSSIVFFGACAVVGIRRALDTGPQLTISAQGIQWRPWSQDTIPWREIRDVSVWEFRRQKAIVLVLYHPEQYPSSSLAGKLASVNRGLTGGDISISLTGLDKSFDEAFAAIGKFRRGR
ncbi:MAG: STM3941 family protein [Sphingomicrobium sp.]